MTPVALETERLILRGWRDSDRRPFAALNADPVVMEHFPFLMTPDESERLIARWEALRAQQGWATFAVERKGDSAFLGAAMISNPPYTTPFTPCLEIGWRFSREYWGSGYASEAARTCLAFGFEQLGEPQIFAFTVPANERSQAVMRRIGMRHVDGGEFDHPNVPEGHALKRHVLYRMAVDDWTKRNIDPLPLPSS